METAKRWRQKIRTAAVLALAAMLLPLYAPLPASAAGHEHSAERVLLVYDGLGRGTPLEGSLDVLKRLLASYSAEVTLLPLDEYEPGGAAAFDRTAALMTGSAADEAVLDGLAADALHGDGGYLHIGGPGVPAPLRSRLGLETAVLPQGSFDLTAAGFASARPLLAEDLTYAVSYNRGYALGEMNFQSGRTAAPYAVLEARNGYVSFVQKGNISELALAAVLKEWLADGTAAEEEGRQASVYLLFKEVYPFTDPRLLESLSQDLNQAGIPFMLSVRPIFDNTDYPAMLRFFESLKAAQSLGGTVLVNAPVVNAAAGRTAGRSLQEEMGTFLEVLAAQGLAPLGAGAELHWSYDGEYGKGLQFFDTAVLFPDERVLHMEPSRTSAAFASAPYSLSAELLAEISWEGAVPPDFPLDVALTADLPETPEEQSALMEQVKGYWLPFADFRLGSHRTSAPGMRAESDNGTVVLNGSKLDLAYSPAEIDGAYEYEAEPERSFELLFRIENTVFMIVISVSLAVFVVLLIAGRRLYRRKY